MTTFFLGGPLGEEPGWRGFALPRLQWRNGPLVGSLILGANKVEAPLFPAPILNEYGLLPVLIGFTVTATVLTIATRGRLGYQSGQPIDTRPDGAVNAGSVDR